MNVLQSTILRYYYAKTVMSMCSGSALRVSTRHCSNIQVDLAAGEKEEAVQYNVEFDNSKQKEIIDTKQDKIEQEKVKEESLFSCDANATKKFYSRVKPTQLTITLKNNCSNQTSSLPELEQVLRRQAHLPVPEWATHMRVVRPVATTLLSESEKWKPTIQQSVHNGHKSKTTSTLVREASKVHCVEKIAALAVESVKSQEPYIPLLYRIGLITPPTPLDLSCCVPFSRPKHRDEHKGANYTNKVVISTLHNESNDNNIDSVHSNNLLEISHTEQKSASECLESNNKKEKNVNGEESEQRCEYAPEQESKDNSLLTTYNANITVSCNNDDDDNNNNNNGEHSYMSESSELQQERKEVTEEEDQLMLESLEQEEEEEELEWQNISSNVNNTPSTSLTSTEGSSNNSNSTTNRIFLDPVEWLSQTSSFPLMSESVVSAHLAPVQYGISSLSHELSSTSLHALSPSTSTSTLSSSKELEEMHNNEQKYMENLGKSMLSVKEQQAECARLEEAIKTMQTHQKINNNKNESNNLVVSANNKRTYMSNVEKTASFRGNDTNEYDLGGSSTNTTPSSQDSMSSTVNNSIKSEELIYNIFTRRVSKANSDTIKTLSLMGIAPDCTKRELVVQDKDALHNFATAIQSQCISWPTFWSHGYVYHQLRSIICHSRKDELDTKVNELLKMQYEMLHRRRNERQLTGVVSASELTHLTNTENEDNNKEMQEEEKEANETSVLVHTSTSSSSYSITGMLDDKWLTLDKLNSEQQAVVEFIREGGYHTYIGGGAGSGKSVLLKMIRKMLVHDGLTVAMVATTGVASCQIGGVTLHHLFGINQHGDFTRRSELTAYDVIIIDEVSMLGRDLFEKMEYKLRRAHGIDVPFGGVQMIVCGDFMQLGAINAKSLISSPLFRRHFAMLKLYNIIRQSEDVQYAAQLQMLRRGKVPDNLHETVSLQTTEQILIEQLQRYALAIRQRRQLSFALQHCPSNDKNSNINSNDQENDRKTIEAQVLHNTSDTLPSIHCSNTIHNTQASHTEQIDSSREKHNVISDSSNTCESSTPSPRYVENAVNLLPTNAEVNVINARELARLDGDEVSFAAQILTPTLLGNWTQTYLLRISHPCSNNNNNNTKQQVNLSQVQKIIVEFVNLFVLKYKDSGNAASLHPHRHVVLYKLFVDGYCLRVRIPDDFDMSDCQKLKDHFSELNTFLQTFEIGLTVCDLLDSGEGMHTEEDELILHSYAIKATHSRETKLKKGARVMLRANLAPGLVNGSIGTVIGFRECTARDIPRYLLPYADVTSKSTYNDNNNANNNNNSNNLNAYREEVIRSYADFLVYECGFTKALLPEVELNGRVYVIPPIIYFVGGLHNTHHYSMGVAHLPLSLAYAFTVHKVQGLTLVGRVHLELSRMWPCDHLLYVAMSRVRNPEQLSMSSFSAKLVQAAADCLLFDDSLPSVYNVNVLPSFIQATWKRTPQRRKKLLRQRKLLDEVKRKNKNLAKNSPHNNLSRQIALIQQQMLQVATLSRKNAKK